MAAGSKLEAKRTHKMRGSAARLAEKLRLSDAGFETRLRVEAAPQPARPSLAEKLGTEGKWPERHSLSARRDGGAAGEQSQWAAGSEDLILKVCGSYYKRGR